MQPHRAKRGSKGSWLAKVGSIQSLSMWHTLLLGPASPSTLSKLSTWGPPVPQDPEWASLQTERRGQPPIPHSHLWSWRPSRTMLAWLWTANQLGTENPVWRWQQQVSPGTIPWALLSTISALLSQFCEGACPLQSVPVGLGPQAHWSTGCQQIPLLLGLQ